MCMRGHNFRLLLVLKESQNLIVVKLVFVVYTYVNNNLKQTKMLKSFQLERIQYLVFHATIQSITKTENMFFKTLQK